MWINFDPKIFFFTLSLLRTNTRIYHDHAWIFSLHLYLLQNYFDNFLDSTAHIDVEKKSLNGP